MTITIISESATTRDNNSIDTWNVARQRLLQMLLEVTGCNCAIVRRGGSRAEDLTLEAYAFCPGTKFDEFKVPQAKSIRYFWGANVFETCYVQHYPNGSLEVLRANGDDVDRFNDEEKAFLAAVHWRVSFPVQIDDEVRLAILLSFEVERPTWLTRSIIMQAWLGGQAAVSHQFASNSRSSAFIEASRFATVFSYLHDADLALAALLRILCSGRGLGWHRAWLLRRTGDTFKCEVCAGGLTFENWVRGAEFANSSAQTLGQEISYEILSQTRMQDSMTTAFRGIEVPESWFENPQPYRNGGESWFTLPVELESHDWSDHLVLEASRKGHEYQPSPVYYWCRFEICGNEYAAVLSHWESDRLYTKNPTIETGLLVGFAAEVIGACQVHPESTTLEQTISRLLTFAGLSPFTMEEYERSRSYATRKLYDASEEFRSQIREEMLAIQKQSN